MRDWLLPLLVDPKTHKPLTLTDASREGDEIVCGSLRSPSGAVFPIVRGIPRFVGDDHYAKAFGHQWNTHSGTQIDDSDHQHSKSRFWGETGFIPEGIKNKLGFDGGAGAGRFTRVAAEAGARMVSVDLSEAVEACYANNRDLDVCVVQASLFDLPFRPQSFDFSFTIGVIQHTPDPLRALREVADMSKIGGETAVWWYKRYWYTYLHQKYWLRPFFRLLSDDQKYRFIKWYAPKLLPVSRLLAKMIPFDPKLCIPDRILPVANRDYVPGLKTEAQRIDWSILDTYDWFQPHYDKPQTWKAVEGILRDLGFRCERTPHKREGLHGRRVTDQDPCTPRSRRG